MRSLLSSRLDGEEEGWGQHQAWDGEGALWSAVVEAGGADASVLRGGGSRSPLTSMWP